MKSLRSKYFWPKNVYAAMKNLNQARNRTVHDISEQLSSWERRQFINNFEITRDGMRQQMGFDNVARLYQVSER